MLILRRRVTTAVAFAAALVISPLAVSQASASASVLPATHVEAGNPAIANLPWPPTTWSPPERYGPYRAPDSVIYPGQQKCFASHSKTIVLNCSSASYYQTLFFSGGGFPEDQWAFRTEFGLCLGLKADQGDGHGAWGAVWDDVTCDPEFPHEASRWRVIHSFNNRDPLTNPQGGWHQVWQNVQLGTCMAVSQTATPHLVGKDCNILDPAQWIRNLSS